MTLHSFPKKIPGIHVAETHPDSYPDASPPRWSHRYGNGYQPINLPMGFTLRAAIVLLNLS
jgi:hypothetical protein